MEQRRPTPGVARSIRVDNTPVSRIPASLVGSPIPGSAIMSSLASDFQNDHSFNSMASLQSNATPDLLNNDMRSIDLGPPQQQCFKLIDEDEKLQVKNAAELLKKMGVVREKNLQVKVVSIFGNTGEGKSYTLNQIFFGGSEVFKTSGTQTSCTMGIWAAYDSNSKALILDTEGMLGISTSSKQRKRLLLKVLGISDIIIYRTRAERLNTDMYKFLAEASRAYTKYFRRDLEAVAKRASCECIFGPPVYIFHDTRHTNILSKENGQAPEELLKDNFLKQGYTIDGFNSIHYIGWRHNSSSSNEDTDFTGIRKCILNELANNTVRSPRQPYIILNMLQTINGKFSGEIQSSEPSFPDEYFTCTNICTSCNARCTLFMNHTLHDDGPKDHYTDKKCKYNHTYENKVYLCRKCDSEGDRSIVVPKTSSSKDNTWLGLAKYAWAGYVLECEKCGIIYRNRQYWYGNENPNSNVVKEEYQHVWPGNKLSTEAHAGREVLEGVAAISEVISSISSPPTKLMTSWLTNKLNPTYWKPNHLCTEYQHVWPGNKLSTEAHAGREVLEGVAAISEVISSISSPPTKLMTSWLTNKLNPTYWKPNHLCTHCELCKEALSTIHHCRKCGDGFCDECSDETMPVPEMGWGDEDVRVCRTCKHKRDEANDKTEVPEDYLWGSEDNTVRARQVSEAISGTLASAIRYPLQAVKESTRPSYWVPDEQITHCYICYKLFGPKLLLHHCRSCGEGVCYQCSPQQQPVKHRGWDRPVRVCNNCVK